VVASSGPGIGHCGEGLTEGLELGSRQGQDSFGNSASGSGVSLRKIPGPENGTGLGAEFNTPQASGTLVGDVEVEATSTHPLCGSQRVPVGGLVGGP
jgi:hypothetical protein